MEIKEIAESYHDREVYSQATTFPLNGSNECLLTCNCCENKVRTTVSIEHDSKDYSKDMSVCFDCYAKISTHWKENAPEKICPF